MITTLIPTYQRAGLVARAIRSALAQTHHDVHVIVGDNASTDDTESVVSAIASDEPRVAYVRRSLNLGVLGNIADLVRRVTTPYFSILPDDDVLLPAFYAEAISTLSRHESAGLYAGAVLQMTEFGELFRVGIEEWPAGLHAAPDAAINIVRHNLPIWTGVVFRTEHVRDGGGMIREDLGAYTDLECMTRLGLRHGFYIAHTPSACMVVHAGALSASLRVADVWPAVQAVDRHLSDASSIGHAEKTALRAAWREHARAHIERVATGSLATGAAHEAVAAARLLRREFGWSGRTALLGMAAGMVSTNHMMARVLAQVLRRRRHSALRARIAAVSTHRLAPLAAAAART